MSTASDNTAKWAVRKFGGAGLPVGFEYFTTNPNIPAGSLPLLGGVYSRTLYKDLWSWVQEQAGYLIEESEWQEKSAANGGNVPFYSTGDGTTTFRVPSLNCWVKGANGIEEVGSYLSAGLPNITGGKSYMFTREIETPTGALSFTKGDVLGLTTGSAGIPVGRLSFNASRSSSIYGNSDTVQPKSIVGMWLVKAYGTVTNVGSTDVSNIAQGLTELENRVTPIANGGTGATTASGACANIGALSASGGIMTGDIKFSTGCIRRPKNDAFLDIRGGTDQDHGGELALFGIDSPTYPLSFRLIATNGTTRYNLEGFGTGSLKWRGKNIITGGTLYSINYNAGVDIDSGFIAPSNGLVVVSVANNPNMLSLTINKVCVFKSFTSTVPQDITFSFFVHAKDVVEYSKKNGQYGQHTFYPAYE